MNKLYKENGFLSEYGKGNFEKYLDKEVKMLLKTGDSENEINLIGSLIMKRIGDLIFDQIQSKKKIDNKFKYMNDKEFELYLASKYGPQWLLKSLTTEEYERCPPISQEKIKEIMEKKAKQTRKKVCNDIRFSNRGPSFK